MGAGRGAGGQEPEPAFVIIQELPASRRKRAPGDAPKRWRWLLAGAVVVAGLTYAGIAGERHLNPPEVPRFGIVTMPFTDLANLPSVLDPGIASCGARAPRPRETSGKFALEEQAWNANALEGDIVAYSDGGTAPFSGGTQATVTYSARITTSDSKLTPLQISPVAMVYVQDGVVMGWGGAHFDFGSARFGTMGPESVPTLTGSVAPVETRCVDGAPVAGPLPAGEYQVYPVVRLLASPQIAAEAWLSWLGFAVPDKASGASESPGSWDCQHALGDADQAASALCAVKPIGAVSINRDAESISIPYTATSFAKVVDETLIGDPTVVTLRNVRRPDAPAGSPAGTGSLACGVRVANLPWDSWDGAGPDPIDRSVMESFGAAQASRDEGLRLAILPSTPGVTQVTYPGPLRVWIYGWSTDAQRTDALHTDALRTNTPPTILGTATATVAGGAPIPLDRVAGPSVARVTLTDVQWCDGPDGPADAASIRGLTVTAGPATQILDRGPATSALIGGVVSAGRMVVTVDGATTSSDHLATWQAETSSFDDLTR